MSEMLLDRLDFRIFDYTRKTSILWLMGHLRNLPTSDGTSRRSVSACHHPRAGHGDSVLLKQYQPAVRNRHFHTGLTNHKHQGLYWLVTVYTAVARASQSGLPTDEGAQPSRTN